MPPPDLGVVADIVIAARYVLEFTAGMDEEQLSSDVKHRSAVIYQLMLIGEAAKNVSPDFRSAHPQIPWKQMAGMRNVLIHKYWGTDTGIIWRTVSESIPALLRDLEPLVASEEL